MVATLAESCVLCMTCAVTRCDVSCDGYGKGNGGGDADVQKCCSAAKLFINAAAHASAVAPAKPAPSHCCLFLWLVLARSMRVCVYVCAALINLKLAAVRSFDLPYIAVCIWRIRCCSRCFVLPPTHTHIAHTHGTQLRTADSHMVVRSRMTICST